VFALSARMRAIDRMDRYGCLRAGLDSQCLLWLESVVSVDQTASAEAVMNHTLGKQKKHNCHND